MYQLFLDLDDLLAACAQVGAPLTVQAVQKVGQSTIPTVEASLMLTAGVPTPTPGGPRLLAARVVVEETQLWPDDTVGSAALTARLGHAATLLTAACTAAGVPRAPHEGILAEPGLLADLWRISTTHSLWRMMCADPRKSSTWTLQPRPTESESLT